ncbi:SLC13 family permease [Prosthecobacter sp.]|jgi:di/tricarboxylate transporter|uniref:SLC13 family permease n=1 Tax=Prosthecobacter sp. TaxID=1965333 RepID=UPI0037839A96
MEAWIVIGLLVVAVIAFATEKISVDLVTLTMLCVLVLCGILRADQAFAGFGDRVIILLAAIFVIGAALRETGVLDLMGGVLAQTFGTQPKRLMMFMMAVVGGVSAFMNNTTVTAVFVGPVTGLARRLKIPPSRLLMPLAFASLLGGTCTLIGTSTNVAVSGAISKLGLKPFTMFEFTAVGLVILFTGILYMVFIGTRLVPERDRDAASGGDAMREFLAEVVVLPHSPLIGQEAFDSDFSALEFQVLKIRRDDQQYDAAPHLRFAEGDVVLVAGKVENLIKVKKIEGIDILEDVTLRSSGVDMRDAQVAEVVIAPRSGFVGHSLREGNFRQRTGLSVLALTRGDRALTHHMADEKLRAGDVLLLQGPSERFRAVEEGGEMLVMAQHQFSAESRRRGFMLLGAFVLAVLLSSFDWVPDTIAFVIVALLAVLTRCIKLENAYANIDWRLLILIGGMMAFGEAMKSSGASAMVADTITTLLQPWGVFAVFAGFCLLTILLTQPMSNAAAALVVLPVALQAAASMGVNQRAFAIGVMLSASASVLTPFEPSCILVYGPGKYRFADFIKVGGGLTFVMLLVVLALVPLFWPLQ